MLIRYKRINVYLNMWIDVSFHQNKAFGVPRTNCRLLFILFNVLRKPFLLLLFF